MSMAANCPDPETSSLKAGIPPAPWVVSPYSANSPQGEAHAHFVRANVLVAGYGVGVVCTYRISVGDYSIWQPVRTKIPAPVDYRWIDTLGGFVCTDGLTQCQFYVAEEATS
ncbi:MAG: DUF3757 domain-containing protein [Legionellales bacterium]